MKDLLAEEREIEHFATTGAVQGPGISTKETLKLPKSFGNQHRIVSFAEFKTGISI